ncbi:MAG: hypothetical protein ABI881_15340 [Betaproteobacteria bacterium]
MSKIIAGRFIEQAETDAALEKLVAAGFARDKLAAFFVNSPGKHDLYPTGGDEDESTGTGSAGPGAAAGAAAGGAIGAAAGSVLGPAGAVAGAAVGAYVGSLPGALDNMEKRTGIGGARHTVTAPREREAGMMLAVATPDAASEASALRILRSCNATDIEQGEGEIRNGEWVDFDPLSLPAAASTRRT